MKTISPNLHIDQIKFIENNNQYALKKQKECLRDDMQFKYVEPEKPSLKRTIPPHNDESASNLPKHQISTEESLRMQKSMQKTNSFYKQNVSNNSSVVNLNGTTSTLTMYRNDSLLKNESIQSINFDEVIMKNRDHSLKPAHCQSNISLNQHSIQGSQNLSLDNNDFNKRSGSVSRSSDREQWRKRIENVDNGGIAAMPDTNTNTRSNIDNIAEAMGMSRISFDREAN